MKRKQLQRRYCTCCNRKQFTENMQHVYYRLLKKHAWHCNYCLSATQDNLQILPGEKEKYFLELFSGSKTVSYVAEKDFHYRVFNIDNNAAFNPALCTDIAKLSIKMIPDSKRVFCLWASVPCQFFTVMNIKDHWDKITYSHRQYYYIPKTKQARQAIQLLEKTLWIIKTINPVYYFIENPRGALRHCPQINFAPFLYTVSYSDFNTEYYKPTDIFTNCSFLTLPKVRSSVGRKFKQILDLSTSFERSIVPPGLVSKILQQIEERHFNPA